MQTALTYRTNRDLFSNHYLDEHLPETEAWNEVSEAELEEAREEIRDLWEEQRGTVAERTESGLEEKFIRPMFRKLGIPFEVEETVQRGQRRPDYGFFPSEEVARQAFDNKNEGGDFYENAVAVADAKRWGRPLDTRGSGEHERDFENPSYQIHVYLQETPARWAVLTDGKKWRLYYGPTSHRLDSYYEVDLPTVLEEGDLEDFKFFYLFFRHEAFLEDAGGDCFLDDVYDESNVFAQELGEDLQDNIYEAIKVLSEGYLQYPDNDLEEADLDLVHDASLIYLYRLIFVLYAEAEGRNLLDTDNEIYEESYSLNALKQEVAAELDSGDPKYHDWQDDLSSRLEELFALIDQGSESRGIPEDDLHIPAYNGGLFRTDPDEDDDPEAQFLAEHTVGDAHLARVIELLTRSRRAEGGGKIFVDYSSLDVRHLGSIYEGLLEYQLHVADGPMALDDGEYVAAAEGDDGDAVAVEEGEVYLTTGSGERKATGSYYTPEYVVEYIVDETLGPLVEEIREDLVGQTSYRKGDEEAGTFADEFAERVFDLKILDPAMGSGHFLTSAVDYLAREIIDAQEKQAAQEGIETVEEDHDINWARRKVAQRCIYGVDLNPLATELAKVSLWLRTLAAEQPLAFLDHHLKTGNSLVGSDIEDVLADGEEDADGEVGTEGGGEVSDGAATADGQVTFTQFFDHARQEALAHVMDRFADLLSIDNETLADAKEMEDVYDEVREDPLYRHLLAMANVHTADRFGLDVPGDAYERMARALQQSAWDSIEEQDWFKSAQAMADDEQFFHWELEFPVAFYDADGDRMENAGFDAVIGNPPYIRSRNLPDEQKEYYKSNYATAEGAFDIYIPFIELAAEISDLNSYIIPNKWTTTGYGENLRSLLLEEVGIHSITDVSVQDVFPTADIYPVILQTRGVPTDVVSIRKPRTDEGLNDLVSTDIRRETIQDIGGIIPVNLDPAVEPLVSGILERCARLGDYVEMTEAIHTGNVREKLIVDEPVDDTCEKLVDGKSIDRYLAEWSGQYIRYDESLIDSDNGEYGDLRDRDLFDRDGKLFIRDISYRPVAAFDARGLFALNTLYSVTPETEEVPLKYLLAVFNSQFVNSYYRQIYGGTHVSGDYLRFKPMFSLRIPIPLPETARQLSVNDEENALQALENAADDIYEAKQRKTDLNLDLLDYLGNYEDGPRLPDIGLFQPAASGVLDATAEDYEKLRVGDVRAERDGTAVTVSATARYKPEDEDAHETDTYGYTETDYLEAFTLLDLSETEAALVEAFVPVAVDEAGGFAGFRDNATKTNSPLDRLKAMTLPDPEDVAADLDRYVETKERAEELDAKIEKTDALIDEIVYDLYDLTDEEIEIVESAVADD
ncbi:hypothetical protein GCM10027435_13490 [Haloparvum alkalitolerans]|uniref:Eco57I restriction-modification methylase domain-containing protein n=1 Tax=Haloparvum alkalitolerans TaxID=1042953 RepID=UPI003CF44693